MRDAGGKYSWFGPAIAASLALSALTCTQERDTSPVTPVYRADVEKILTERCATCHSGDLPKGGWNATSYLGAIACVDPTKAVAVLPLDGSAPLLRALDDATHSTLPNPPTAAERARLVAWVNGGSPAFQGTAHSPGFIDPRSDAFHGKYLRDARWVPMLDAKSPDACGRCHEGAPSGRADKVTVSAPGATKCTTCHTDPNGPLGCATCHGDGTRNSPPRDPCFFPVEAARAGAHVAHVLPGTNHVVGLPCTACHAAPSPDVPSAILTGAHGNGAVEVNFDPNLVGSVASYDPKTGTCTVGCHNRGGTRPVLAWTDKGPLDCNSCHTAPPKPHYTGRPCTFCHNDANADGTALQLQGPAALHVNGKVDLGDGSGKCGACHGTGDDPWPKVGAHPAHENPKITVPLVCTNCHPVPSSLQNIHDAPHLSGKVDLVFGGRALDRGSIPQWNGTSCTSVACHGNGLTSPPPVNPVWLDPSTGACGSCHGIPPTTIHTPNTGCQRVECHGAEIERDPLNQPIISQAGKALHIDGIVEHK